MSVDFDNFDNFDISSFQDFVPGKPKKVPTPKLELLGKNTKQMFLQLFLLQQWLHHFSPDDTGTFTSMDVLLTVNLKVSQINLCRLSISEAKSTFVAQVCLYTLY